MTVSVKAPSPTTLLAGEKVVIVGAGAEAASALPTPTNAKANNMAIMLFLVGFILMFLVCFINS